MLEFFNAVMSHAMLQNTLLVGVLAAIAAGIVGTYVVVRRITVIAGSIAHCVLGGLGLANYLKVAHGMTWLEPMYGAIASALLAAIVIGLVSLRAKQREDMVIAAVWSIGMAVGVLFINKTPGYQADLMSYLFGNIMMVSRDEVMLLLALDAIVVGIAFLFHQQFVAVCFDEEFARLRGVAVERYYLLLLCLTAVTVVLLVKVVGIVMVIALLTLPVAVAGNFTRSMIGMMGLAALLSAAFSTAGLAVSYGPNLPTGATTIVIAGGVYLLVLGGKRLFTVRAARPAGG
jgi:zinc transport system permease protein